jgi:hypothetical protein
MNNDNKIYWENLKHCVENDSYSDTIYYFNLHLISGEYLSWINGSFDPKDGLKEYKKERSNLIVILSSKISLKTHKDSFELIFLNLEGLLNRIQSDISRDKLFSDIQFNERKDEKDITTLNLELTKIDSFFMSYKDITNLILSLNLLCYNINKIYNDINIDKNIEIVCLLVYEKAKFLFNKAIIARADATKPDYDSNHFNEILLNIPVPENMQLNFLESESKRCQWVCSPVGFKDTFLPFISEKANSAIDKLDLNTIYWILRFYRSKNSFEGENITLPSIDTLKGVIKSRYNVYRNGYVNYNYESISSIIDYIEFIQFKLDLNNYKIDEVDVNFFKNKLNEIRNNRMFFYYYREYAHECRNYYQKIFDKISSKDLLILLRLWAISLHKWQSNIYDAIQFNFHPFFSITNESKYRISVNEYFKSRYPNLDLDKIIKEKHFDIFISSGYMSPFDKDYLLNKLNEEKNKYYDAMQSLVDKSRIEIEIIAKDNAIEIAEEISKEMLEEAKSEAKISAEDVAVGRLKTVENQTINILSIFASVLTFATATVVMPKFVDSFGSALIFLSTLGFGLTSFVATLLFFYRRDGTSGLNFAKKAVLIIILLGYFGVIEIGLTLNESTKTMNHKSDSIIDLTKEKNILDSIMHNIKDSIKKDSMKK